MPIAKLPPHAPSPPPSPSGEEEAAGSAAPPPASAGASAATEPEAPGSKRQCLVAATTPHPGWSGLGTVPTADPSDVGPRRPPWEFYSRSGVAVRQTRHGPASTPSTCTRGIPPPPSPPSSLGCGSPRHTMPLSFKGLPRLSSPRRTSGLRGPSRTAGASTSSPSGSARSAPSLGPPRGAASPIVTAVRRRTPLRREAADSSGLPPSPATPSARASTPSRLTGGGSEHNERLSYFQDSDVPYGGFDVSMSHLHPCTPSSMRVEHDEAVARAREQVQGERSYSAWTSATSFAAMHRQGFR